MRLLLGQGVNFKLRKITSRILFIATVIVYTLITNDIYSVIVSNSYTSTDLVINNIEDLAKSELSLHAPNELPLVHFNNPEDETFKLLDERIKYNPNCINEMVNLRNVICLTKSVDGRIATEQYREQDGSPMMYIAFKYHTDEFYYIFEPASPYLKRFMTVIRRVQASGVIHHAIHL